MNNDLISREALKEILNKTEGIEYDSRTVVEEVIDNAPTVDFEKLGESLNCQIRATYGSCDDCLLSCPRNELIKLLGLARPQGVWIDCKDIPYLANCSNCGYQMDTHEERGYFRFCPYCGADMRGKEE